MATTRDSGRVIDRRSGEETPLRIDRLWTLAKLEEEWVATSIIQNITTVAIQPSSRPNDEISTLLQTDAEAMQHENVEALLANLDKEEFVVYTAFNKPAHTTWRIAFSDPDEFKTWLDKRLSYTNYTIERNLLHTQVSENALGALALTQEKVSVTYDRGQATHSLDRYVVWGLSRTAGSWKISQVFTEFPIPNQDSN